MKRGFSFSGGLIVGALIFGIGGIFFGYVFAHHSEPSVIVRNFTHSTIQQIRIETSIGETYIFQNIHPEESRRTQIAKGDMALWVVATSPTGETKKSKQIYVSSQGTVFVAVSDDAITLDYEP
ncbi:hypothetical protein PJI16_16540 [Nitrospira sp. MA-1]|nr:hypothetical protein [Nitrospira sp. MA-1]